MLDNRTSDLFKVENTLVGGTCINEIVVRHRLALQLLRTGKSAFFPCIKSGVLVWVFPVAQTRNHFQRQVYICRPPFGINIGIVSAVQPPKNCGVILSCSLKSFGCKLQAQPRRNSTVVGTHLGHHKIIVSGVNNHRDTTMIFCCRTYHRRASDVDIFHSLFKSYIALGDNSLKRV